VAENHPVQRVTVINSKNDAVTLSIDSDTHLPVKETFTIRDFQGFRLEIGEIYDNWKVIEGINTPYNIVITRNGELQSQYFLASVSYDRHLPDSLFTPLSERKP
jgi:hypothetical protein